MVLEGARTMVVDVSLNKWVGRGNSHHARDANRRCNAADQE
jgi:hypothetical protein